jgi:protein-S-isoprenylcysteine O-methyltransferase Ste14
MSVRRQARAIALLPGNVTIVVPAVILILTAGPDPGWGLGAVPTALVVVIGIGLIAAGFSLWLWTVRLFSRIGRGTLAAWDQTSVLVVEPCSYVRNPMITAVAVLLVGEALLLGSVWILIWAAAFLTINFTYFLCFEEPGLERRFGERYRAYKRNVPRWIPRLDPWRPDRSAR